MNPVDLEWIEQEWQMAQRSGAHSEWLTNLFKKHAALVAEVEALRAENKQAAARIEAMKIGWRDDLASLMNENEALQADLVEARAALELIASHDGEPGYLHVQVAGEALSRLNTGVKP